MLVRHHNVPYFVFLEINFKHDIREDSLKICFLRIFDQEACCF